ncbi:MAG: DegT/DnrJ/EryC1/StrS family aminotransferase [Desulfovibrionaceae bacterium]
MPIPLFKPYFPEPMRRAILADMDEIMSSGRLMFGPQQKRFEPAFAERVGTAEAVSVNTCTTALTICLKYLGAEGGEVLVPSGTFLTSVSSVLFAGGTPVLVDMNPETLALDPGDLARKLTPRTKGVVWVHLTGVVSHEYEKIVAFCKDNGLFLIEDCAHALGAAADGAPVGSLGDAGCFSFYPTKITTSGTGGMIATSNPGLAEYARQMRIFGKVLDGPDKNEIIHLGNDWFLDEFRCCVAYHQLTLLDEIIAGRNALAQRYREALAEAPGIAMTPHPENLTFTYYQFPVFLDPALDHAGFLDALHNDHGVQAKAIYKPTHQERALQRFDTGDLQATESTLGRSACLPLYLGMTDEEFETVVGGVKAALEKVS